MKTAFIMKNSIKLAVIVTVGVIGAMGIGSAATQKGLASGEVSSPRTLYVQNCANCHGADGRADTAKGRELDADDLTTAKVQNMSTAKIIRVITNGKGDMPALGRKLTPAQIRSIAGYVRVF